jgi:hypothetical protein
MAEHAMESKLRPAVELYTVAICIAAAVLCVYSPWAVALSPEIGLVAALAYALFGLIRLRQAWEVLRYRRNIRRLPRYELTSRQIPSAVSVCLWVAAFAGPACTPSAWSRPRIRLSPTMSTNRPATVWPVDSNAAWSMHRFRSPHWPVSPLGTVPSIRCALAPSRWLAAVAWGRAQ